MSLTAVVPLPAYIQRDEPNVESVQPDADGTIGVMVGVMRHFVHP